MFAILALLTLGAEDARGSKQAEVTVALRRLLEPAYRKHTGLGFRLFECPLERPLRPGDLLDCNAVDDEGDRLRYTLRIDDAGNAQLVLESQDVSGTHRPFLPQPPGGQWLHRGWCGDAGPRLCPQPPSQPSVRARHRRGPALQLVALVVEAGDARWSERVKATSAPTDNR